jgi:hypothetical protein
MHALLETEHSIMTDATSLANNLDAGHFPDHRPASEEQR